MIVLSNRHKVIISSHKVLAIVGIIFNNIWITATTFTGCIINILRFFALLALTKICSSGLRVNHTYFKVSCSLGAIDDICIGWHWIWTRDFDFGLHSYLQFRPMLSWIHNLQMTHALNVITIQIFTQKGHRCHNVVIISIFRLDINICI